MPTTFRFHTTVPSDGTITLPPEFRGKPVRIAVENEPKSSVQNLLDNDAGGGGGATKGILSIAGILKDGPNENIRDERYEYLMGKYGHGKNTD